MFKQRRSRVVALLLAAAIGFSILGSRTSGRLADLSFAVAVVIALGLLYVGLYGRFLAWAWIDEARSIDDALRSVFPRMQRWSWPLALVVTLVLGVSVVVLRAWWHAPPEQTAHIDYGDKQWLRDLMKLSDRPH